MASTNQQTFVKMSHKNGVPSFAQASVGLPTGSRMIVNDGIPTSSHTSVGLPTGSRVIVNDGIPTSSHTTPSSAHVCDVCQKSFTLRKNLKQHQKTHSRDKSFACDICDKSFTRNSDLKRHSLTHGKTTSFTCQECGARFLRKDNFSRHVAAHKTSFHCNVCSETFQSRQNLNHHIRVKHSVPATLKRKSDTSPKQVKKSRGVLDVFTKHTLKPTEETQHDLLVFLKSITADIQSKLEQHLAEQRNIKWYAVCKLNLTRVTSDGEEEQISTFFRNKCITELTPDTITQHIHTAFKEIENSFEEFIKRGSGWTLNFIEHLELNIAKYNPLRASTYIALPQKLSSKKALLNIQNFEDNKCFIWCVLAHQMNLDRDTHPHRVSHYIPFEAQINMGNVTCPVPLSKINTLEKLNNIRVNIFGYEENECFPLYISKQSNTDVINLLLISNDTNQHYVLIRDMSRLLGDVTHHDGQTHICYRCLHRFSTEQRLNTHLEYCSEHSPQNIKLPQEGENIMEFKNFNYQHPIQYIIYSDFEAILTKVHTAERSADTSHTDIINVHEPCGYSYVIVGPDGKSTKPITTYRGENAVQHFLEAIIKEKEVLVKKLMSVKPLQMSNQDIQNFQNSTHCNLCSLELGDDRVRDHDHITGKYRGALHNSCNLKYKMRKMIPVVFHNLKNYDAHLIMQGLGKIKDHDINVIGQTMEKYISFTLSKKYFGVSVSLQFIDSFQFLSTSLEKLVANLNPLEFKILKQNIAHNHDLLIRKGVYPYEYMDNFAKFNETTLPPRSAFFSSLTQDTITQQDYEHALKVWNTFGIQNLGQYHDLYLKTDVLLLADVFQNFRALCLKYYQLDAAHLMTSPGLSWQACLKMCQQPLELFTDLDMHLFIERGIRGGVSNITKRYSEANNQYMPTYDSEKASKYIMYLDANNLYGWAMSQALPYGNFKWVEKPELITEEVINSMEDDASQGLILEVDLEYPKELHKIHNDYPLAPENFLITSEMCSPYNKNLLNQFGMHNGTKNIKLVPNLNDKTNYVIHYRNLKLYLSLGLKLKKVHKALSFDQKPWLRPYIEFNTEKRKNATSSFEKDFFKLLNNSVYGKTIENVRNWIDILLVNNELRAEKLVAAPTFHAFKVFTEDLVGVQRVRKSILLNRPLYVGFAILELSKVHMYNFHYNYMKKQYGEAASLLFTDTDSLTYEIQTSDIYQDMAKHPELFHTSDYPQSHFLHSQANKKKIGCFKDELNGKIAFQFVGLRSKMYSLQSEDGEKKTAKGVARNVVQKNIKHEHYKNCLFTKTFTREKQFRINSSKHQLHTIQQSKIALSPFDDKRYVLDNAVNTLAYGHYKISNL